MRAHPDPGNTATATSGTSQRALDESIQSAVQRARESDGIGEIEGDPDRTGAMPRANGVDPSCCSPGERMPAVFTELRDQSRLGETLEFTERADTEPFQPLDDERVDRQ